MLEIAAFTSVLTSLGGLIKVANESKNVEMTAKLIELQQKIPEMHGEFGELQQKLFETQQENRELKDRQRGVDDDADFQRSLTYNENLGVWHRVVEGVEETYCGACLNEGKRVGLRKKGVRRAYHCQFHGYRD